MRVLVTGATRGIGRGLVDHYRAQGHTAIGTYRGARPETGDWLLLDAADPTSFPPLAHELDGRAVDVLVCNAGVYLDKGERLADGYAADLWADSFAVNVTGVFLTVQTLLPALQMSKAPKIAVISSQMASSERAPGGSYIYRASKAAALNLGRNLAADLRELGIAVGIYHPGWVRTDMGSDAAAISVEEAVTGLSARFDALSLNTTGCFETWDGQAYPY